MSDEFVSVPSQSAGTQAPVWELSGWWRRVGASVIDYLVVWIPVSVLIEIFALGPDPAAGDTSISANFDFVGMVSFLFASAIYFMTTMSAWNGQTVGKRVTSIRVVREDGMPVDAMYAFKRQTLVMGLLFGWFAALLLFIPTLLNYLWPLWDDKHQALHDKIVKSRVVRSQLATTGPIQYAPQPVAPFPTAEPPAPYASPAPTAPPPPPPPPSGTSTPYTPPPGFENPVPDEDN